MVKRKKILITGANGFIGGHLKKRLKKDGFVVKTFDREKTSFTNVEVVVKELKNIDAVVHLGGKVRGTVFELVEANLISTLGLLEAISTLPKKPLFIFASTFAVYTSQEEKLSEKSLLGSNNIYGLSKQWCEEAVINFSKRNKINSLVLRIANVYGAGIPPYSHSVVATFLDQIKNNKELTVNGDGNQVRDFVYIEDLVDAIVRGIKSRINGYEIVNISSGREVSLNKLIRVIEKITNKKSKVKYNLDIKESGYWIGSNLKAKKILGWKPATKLEEGLALTYGKAK